MATLASALVLNIGTLTSDFVESMILAARKANERDIPVVLDVCGAGATPFRDAMCAKILSSVRIDVIKGNASEVARVAGVDVRTRGVDAGEVSSNLAEIAASLSRARRCTVAITGKVDIVAGSESIFRVANGVDMMTRVVGTGCMATSVIGTFAGASPEDTPAAAAAALSCYGIAAEMAAERADGPASFKTALLDALAVMNKDDIQTRQRFLS